MSSGCRRRKKGAKRDIFRVAFEKCTSWLVGLVDNVVEIEIEHCRRHQQQQQQQQRQQQFAHTTPTTTNAQLAHKWGGSGDEGEGTKTTPDEGKFFSGPQKTLADGKFRFSLQFAIQISSSAVFT
ncbi:hypothetical protein T08_8818 [Trichinella sp. T8]|nr:hypothetical protein T08_8818 [Trichinella sp. T8]